MFSTNPSDRGIRLMEKILHHQKHLKSRPSCSPLNIGKKKLSPKQRSWMTELLHRRTRRQNTQHWKGGADVQIIMYCQICPRAGAGFLPLTVCIKIPETQVEKPWKSEWTHHQSEIPKRPEIPSHQLWSTKWLCHSQWALPGFPPKKKGEQC